MVVLPSGTGNMAHSPNVGLMSRTLVQHYNYNGPISRWSRILQSVQSLILMPSKCTL